MNGIDLLLLAAVAAALVLAVRAVVHGKTGGCCGDCSACGRTCSEKEDLL